MMLKLVVENMDTILYRLWESGLVSKQAKQVWLRKEPQIEIEEQRTCFIKFQKLTNLAPECMQF